MRIPGTNPSGPSRLRCRTWAPNSNHWVVRTIVKAGLNRLAVSSWAFLPAKYPYP